MPSKTPLHAWHVGAGARMVDFSGWEMPVHYPRGIIHEHLTVRRHGGLFDVSHMGRFRLRGPEALDFLRFALTNDASLLDPGKSQYTIIADDDGFAVDDAYLYRWTDDEYILIVNAGNLTKDWNYLRKLAKAFDVELADLSPATAMIAVQGPGSDAVLGRILEGAPPPAGRNHLAVMSWQGTSVQVGRTGYTGEPVGCEIISPAAIARELWEAFVASGMEPIGLGARDTLRLEAGLPLYGHEFGVDPEGGNIPVFACPLARFAVKLPTDRPPFVGGKALERQLAALKAESRGAAALPRRISHFLLDGRGIAREKTPVFHQGRQVGWVTSGTMVPYWIMPAPGEFPDDKATGLRAIGLALLDCGLPADAELEFVIREKPVPGHIVPAHLNNRGGQFALPIIDN